MQAEVRFLWLVDGELCWVYYEVLRGEDDGQLHFVRFLRKERLGGGSTSGGGPVDNGNTGSSSGGSGGSSSTVYNNNTSQPSSSSQVGSMWSCGAFDNGNREGGSPIDGVSGNGLAGFAQTSFLGISREMNYKTRANHYNSGLPVLSYNNIVNLVFNKALGTSPSAFGINSVSTNVPEGYGLTKNGLYYNYNDHSITNGLTFPTSEYTSKIHIAPHYANNSLISRALAAHEFGHAYHIYTLGYTYTYSKKEHSEAACYEIQYNMLMGGFSNQQYDLNTRNLLYNQAQHVLDKAIQKGYYYGGSFHYDKEFTLPKNLIMFMP